MPDTIGQLKTNGCGCCDEYISGCGLTGSMIAQPLQITYPAACTSGHAGAKLLTNYGTYAEFNAATGINLSDPGDICMVWWLQSATSTVWYLLIIEYSADISVQIRNTASPFNSSNWINGTIADWSDFDGWSTFTTFIDFFCPGADNPIIAFPP